MNKLIEALQLIANSNTKLADDKNVLKAQLMWIKNVAKEALSQATIEPLPPKTNNL